MTEIPIRARCSSLCAVHCPGHSAGSWDPVPYLAQLIDGVRRVALSGGDPRDIAMLLSGPAAALRGGLLLDEPGREGMSTEAALREVLP